MSHAYVFIKSFKSRFIAFNLINFIKYNLKSIKHYEKENDFIAFIWKNVIVVVNVIRQYIPSLSYDSIGNINLKTIQSSKSNDGEFKSVESSILSWLPLASYHVNFVGLTHEMKSIS